MPPHENGEKESYGEEADTPSAACTVTDTLRCAEDNPTLSDLGIGRELLRRCAGAYKDLVLKHLAGEGVRTASASATFSLCVVASLAPSADREGYSGLARWVGSSVAFPRSWCPTRASGGPPRMPPQSAVTVVKAFNYKPSRTIKTPMLPLTSEVTESKGNRDDDSNDGMRLRSEGHLRVCVSRWDGLRDCGTHNTINSHQKYEEPRYEKGFGPNLGKVGSGWARESCAFRPTWDWHRFLTSEHRRGSTTARSLRAVWLAAHRPRDRGMRMLF